MAGASKRKTSALPQDFREQILREATASAERGGQWLLPYAIAYATGCRPAELREGVHVRLNPSGHIEAVIRGAKINAKQGRGMPIRVQVLRTKDAENKPYPWATPLLDALAKDPKLVVKISSPDAFSKRIAEASRKLWPKRHEHASAYSLRHAFARDLKVSNSPQVMIAGAMGHATTKAQGSYGWKRRRTKGQDSPLAEVKTSATVRSAPDKLLRFKIAAKLKKSDLGARIDARTAGAAPAVPTSPRMSRRRP